jgi:hypothetical protein
MKRGEPEDPELAAQRRARTTEGLGLFADPTPDAVASRHVAAIASVEQSGTPNETAIVIRIQAELRTRATFTADDVAALLTEAGVPRRGPGAGDIRRRYASRIVSGGRTAGDWKPVGKVMTKDNVRSGREITRWKVIPRSA